MGSLVVLTISLLGGGGLGEVTTPCVCVAAAAVAMLLRQHAANVDRPMPLTPQNRKKYTDSLRYLFTEARKTGRFVQVDPKTIPANYSGAKRAHYELCYLELVANGFKKGYFSLMAKWGECQGIKPRAIIMQVCRAVGCVGVKCGTILRLPILLDLTVSRPLEAAMHRMRNKDGTHLFASGHSLHFRGEHINMMMQTHYAVSIDAKSFDGAQGWLSILCRRIMLEHIKLRFFGKAVRLAFQAQDYMTIKARGLRATIIGNRASGTGSTATGNKIVMVAVLISVFDELYHKGKVAFYSDGDDTLIFVHHDIEIAEVDRRIAMMDGYLAPLNGSSTTREGDPALQTEDVIFCRAQPVKTKRGWMLVKNPLDAVRTQFTIRRHFKCAHILKDYLATLAVGFRMLFMGVPVLGALWRVFGSVEGKVRHHLLAGTGIDYAISREKQTSLDEEVTSEARASFTRAFGISTAAQLCIEKIFVRLGPIVAVAIKVPLPRAMRSRVQAPTREQFAPKIPRTN